MSNNKTEIDNQIPKHVVIGECREALSQILHEVTLEATAEARKKVFDAEQAFERLMDTPTYLRNHGDSPVQFEKTINKCRDDLWEETRKFQRRITTVYWTNEDGINFAVAVGLG
jgi:hypothetical protein